jgi:hypothetical protein
MAMFNNGIDLVVLKMERRNVPYCAVEGETEDFLSCMVVWPEAVDQLNRPFGSALARRIAEEGADVVLECVRAKVDAMFVNTPRFKPTQVVAVVIYDSWGTVCDVKPVNAQDLNHFLYHFR